MKLRLTKIYANGSQTNVGEVTFEEFVEANGGKDVDLVYVNFDGRHAGTMERLLKEFRSVDLPLHFGGVLRVQVIV